MTEPLQTTSGDDRVATVVSKRYEQIVALAQSLHDLTFEPLTGTAKIQRRSAFRGPAPTRVVECEACEGTGKTTDRYRRVNVCERCTGKGRYAVDTNLNPEHRKPLGTEEATVSEVHTTLCDRCGGTGMWKTKRCVTCDGDGRREWRDFNLRIQRESAGDAEGALLSALEHRDTQGSWRELEGALVVLSAIDDEAHRAFRNTYILNDQGAQKLEELGRALRIVEPIMPDPIKVPAYVRAAVREREKQLQMVRGVHTPKEALRARNREIRRLFDEGEATIEELIRRFNVGRTQVYEAINGDRSA